MMMTSRASSAKEFATGSGKTFASAARMGGRRSTARVVTAMVGRKVVTEDKDWNKGLGSVGIFLEDKEKKVTRRGRSCLAL